MRGWPMRSATIETVIAPTGTSVSAAWTGWPSHVPSRKSLTGRMGRNSAVNQRWLNSPNGFDHLDWASTARLMYRPSIVLLLLLLLFLLRRSLRRAFSDGSCGPVTL